MRESVSAGSFAMGTCVCSRKHVKNRNTLFLAECNAKQNKWQPTSTQRGAPAVVPDRAQDGKVWASSDEPRSSLSYQVQFLSLALVVMQANGAKFGAMLLVQ